MVFSLSPSLEPGSVPEQLPPMPAKRRGKSAQEEDGEYLFMDSQDIERARKLNPVRSVLHNCCGYINYTSHNTMYGSLYTN